jgi:hypothetical protein
VHQVINTEEAQDQPLWARCAVCAQWKEETLKDFQLVDERPTSSQTSELRWAHIKVCRGCLVCLRNARAIPALHPSLRTHFYEILHWVNETIGLFRVFGFNPSLR